MRRREEDEDTAESVQSARQWQRFSHEHRQRRGPKEGLRVCLNTTVTVHMKGSPSMHRSLQMVLKKYKQRKKAAFLCLSHPAVRLHPQEMRKFLALPIEEKTTHAARTTAKLKNELVGEEEEEEEEEEHEKAEDSKQMKSKTALPGRTSGRRELKMSTVPRRALTSVTVFLFTPSCSQLSLMTKRSEILKMDKAMAKEERQLKKLEKVIERDNLNFEAFLRENEKKSVEARTQFEQEAKIKLDIYPETCSEETVLFSFFRSELVKIEEILADYKKYQELLFRLSPPEWQEAQKIKALKGKVLSEQSRKPDQVSGKKSRHFTEARGETRRCRTAPLISSCQFEELKPDEPELYFTDPQQLLDLMTMLTEQNLSLIKNSARMEEEEEQMAAQVNDVKQRIDREKPTSALPHLKHGATLRLVVSPQDEMLDALGEKVAEVHRCCVDDRLANLSTLEKLSNIERRMSSLLQGLESIPEDKLEMTKKIKDSERRKRRKAETAERKQSERMRRYMERSLADSKKTVSSSLLRLNFVLTAS
uniref:DUF4200 domain-containing protein n=1 Tax=Salarias fasciatus TaxID=181472 RepID=A0A672GPR7_SALFA